MKVSMKSLVFAVVIVILFCTLLFLCIITLLKENIEMRTAIILNTHTDWIVQKIDPVESGRTNIYYRLTVSSITLTNTMTLRVPAWCIDQYPVSGDRYNPNADLIGRPVHFWLNVPKPDARKATDFTGFKIEVK